MKLLIASPIYGQPMMPFVDSMSRFSSLTDIDHGLYYCKGDSLVQRARNNIVRFFLETDFTHLLQIDSDIEFPVDAVEKLFDADKPVIGASYPMKKIGVKTTAWKDGELVDIDQLTEITPVDLLGSGFLMVKREVFEDMLNFFPARKHMEGLPGGDPTLLNKGGLKPSFSWFDPRVSDGLYPEEKCYWSEDYAFCVDCKTMGYDILLDPSIKLIHYGTYGYGG